MQKIIPHLWFDTQAKEASAFYASVFPNSEVFSVRTIHDTPSGDCDIATFSVMGYTMQAISAGPYFKINPSISFMVNFDPSHDKDARQRIDDIWKKLTDGGQVLMELDKYPFSERYGWVQDKFGVSWQLIFTDPQGEDRPSIIPSLLFVGDVCGKAEEATNFYLSVFRDSPSTSSGQVKRGAIAKYPAGMEPEKEGNVMFTDINLLGQWFSAMDSGRMHEFGFNEAVSLIINCDSQEEIDYYWEKLSAVPESEQCGWLKDKYGVSWQVVPSDMDEIMQRGTPEQIDRVTQAFLKMKKFNIAELKKAYNG